MRAPSIARRLGRALDRRSRGEKFGVPVCYLKALVACTFGSLISPGLAKLGYYAPHHYSHSAASSLGALVVSLAIIAVMLATIVAALYYALISAYSSARDTAETVASVRRLLKDRAARRRDHLLPRGDGWVTIAAVLLLPSSILTDAIETARDVLMHEADESSSRHVVRVVVRLIWGLVRDGVRERRRFLTGSISGVLGAFTIVPGIQSLLGLHFSVWLGAMLVVVLVVVGGLIGGWTGSLGERRVP